MGIRRMGARSPATIIQTEEEARAFELVSESEKRLCCSTDDI